MFIKFCLCFACFLLFAHVFLSFSSFFFCLLPLEQQRAEVVFAYAWQPDVHVRYVSFFLPRTSARQTNRVCSALFTDVSAADKLCGADTEKRKQLHSRAGVLTAFVPTPVPIARYIVESTSTASASQWRVTQPSASQRACIAVEIVAPRALLEAWRSCDASGLFVARSGAHAANGGGASTRLDGGSGARRARASPRIAATLRRLRLFLDSVEQVDRVLARIVAPPLPPTRASGLSTSST